MLLDVALLEIFGFCTNEAELIQKWHRLVHVCQKWRNIVFGSPHYLCLRLYCRPGTPVRETLNFWPHLPIVIRHDDYPTLGVDSILAALEHNDRVCDIRGLGLFQIRNLICNGEKS